MIAAVVVVIVWPPSGERLCLDGAVEVDAGLLPGALDSAFGDAAHGGDLPEREPAEELQVDHLGEIGIDLGQLLEGVADPGQLLVVGDVTGGLVAVERGDGELAAALLGAPA